MKHYIQKPSILLITSSLLLGAILTVLLLSHMGWSTKAVCASANDDSYLESCTVLEYGYPRRFITPEPSIDENDQLSSTVNFNQANLLYNWLVLSGASFVLLYVLTFEAVWPNELKAKKTSRRKSRGK